MMAKHLNDLFGHIKKDTLTGAIAIIPIAGAIAFFYWLFGVTKNMMSLLNQVFLNYVTLGENWLTILSVTVVLAIFFITGLLLRIVVVNRLHAVIDGVLRELPGIGPVYKAIRETMLQFLGKDEMPLDLVVGFRQNGHIRLGYLTSTDDSVSTVFVPTSPSPTNGMIFAVDNVNIFELPKVSPVDFMRSIISMGAGYSEFTKEFEATEKKGYTLADRLLPA
ncbi:DUF502 domain-containing protein [Candidatus Kaiserbacteria bacterium]|nr:DUF502 domain-containing protein [Candidatus Kaiserbacteria bacterium]USN91962.1 MAG: DUF502 domain-containing protein [Candidatus Nomurabacteria bacterium]